MRLSDLAERRVGLLGFGREGRATLAALQRAGHRDDVRVLDDAPRPEGLALPWHSGDEALRELGAIDVLVVSPGFPPHHALRAAARASGVPTTTATNLFLAECADEDVPVVAVTGSKGKSTTSTLLRDALRAGGREAELAGNVGAAALDLLPDVIARRPVVVFEMSSYQASALDRSCETVIVTELFPEHLDWHGGFEAYALDKLRVAALQDEDALTIWNGANAELIRRAPLGPARHEAYAVPSGVHFADGRFRRGNEVLFGDDGMLLRGEHNRRNACAVIAAAAALGVGAEAVRGVLLRFAGLPHRLADLGTHGGLRWINDSISTAPEAAVAALQSFSGQARTLIAGGQDRGYDFAPLVEAIARHGITRVAVLPPSGLVLGRALRDACSPAEILEAPDLAAAVEWAASVTPPGATVVFSPASPSYGSFANFEERGRRFAELVRALG